MATLSEDRKIGELLVENPGFIRVFEELGIDFCCGGQRDLCQACKEHDVPVSTLLSALEEEAQKPTDVLIPKSPDPSRLSLTELIEHIVENHHAYLETEGPRLLALVEKVAEVHGSRDPRLVRLWKEFVILYRELTTHMMKEERILFPMIREMEANRTLAEFGCGSTSGPIRQMEREHDEAGETLARLKELTDSYTVPKGACATHTALIVGLRAFTHDLHLHIHKENNILHPRAKELENEIRGIASHSPG